MKGLPEMAQAQLSWPSTVAIIWT